MRNIDVSKEASFNGWSGMDILAKYPGTANNYAIVQAIYYQVTDRSITGIIMFQNLLHSEPIESIDILINAMDEYGNLASMGITNLRITEITYPLQIDTRYNFTAERIIPWISIPTKQGG